jgi:hypothetical protein
MSPNADLSVWGEAILYKQFDVGYEIRLDRAFDLLASSGPERRKPVRGEGHAIQIPNPPVTVSLGTEPITIAGSGSTPSSPHVSTISASSRSACESSAGVALVAGVRVLRVGGRHQLRVECIRSMPGPSPGSDRSRHRAAEPSEGYEEYIVFRIGGLRDADGRTVPPTALSDEAIAGALLGERRTVSIGARRHLLSERFSYFDDDLAVLTWNAALIVEPVPEDTDVQFVLEFANAQLLELRYYDAILDEELPRTYDEIASARRGFHLLGRRYSRLLAVLQARVADATEAVERAENALKVTDDVYLARIYAAALEIFRGRSWRQGIDQKVAIIRDAYTMLKRRVASPPRGGARAHDRHPHRSGARPGLVRPVAHSGLLAGPSPLC